MEQDHSSENNLPDFKPAVDFAEIMPTANITTPEIPNTLSEQDYAKLRKYAPDLQLTAGEAVSRIEDFSEKLEQPFDKITPLEGVLRLTGATKPENVGRFGPCLAAMPDLDHPDDPELNKYTGDFADDPVYFARDALVQLEQLGDDFEELAPTTLKFFAGSQGTDFNPNSEEQPGKIVHEFRKPENARAQELTAELGWEWPYYGAVDSTLKYASSLSKYAQDHNEFLDQIYKDKNGDEQTMRHSLEQALEFIFAKQSENELGLIEYKRLNPKGIENQIWRDSKKSMSHSDGTLADYNQPIAAFQAQTDAYDALINSAELYDKLAGEEGSEEDEERAAVLHQRADRLQKVILDRFWNQDQEEGYFVVGLDRNQAGDFRQLDSRTSDMAFALSSRVLDDRINEEKVIATAKSIYSGDMLAASGLRTLSSESLNFSPGAYHNGGVWGLMTYFAAKGFENHDMPQLAQDMHRRNQEVTNTLGFTEIARGGNRPKPELTKLNVYVKDASGEETLKEEVAQRGQGWTVGAAWAAEKGIDPTIVSAYPELEGELLAQARLALASNI